MIFKRKHAADMIFTVLLIALAAVFLIPIFLVLLNSFKSRIYISSAPFAFPTVTATVARSGPFV